MLFDVVEKWVVSDVRHSLQGCGYRGIRFSPRALFEHNALEETGAGEGIRTLDPDLGKVVLYP